MNIFIAKLSSSTTSEGLVEIFQQFGEVKNAKVIIDRETGTSKGYGFVEMANDEEGATAIAELNDSELDGNVIVVKESQPKPAGGGFGGEETQEAFVQAAVAAEEVVVTGSKDHQDHFQMTAVTVNLSEKISKAKATVPDSLTTNSSSTHY